MRIDKRNILVLALVALFGLTASAQPRLRVKEYWVGFHGGVSAGTVLFRPALSGMTPITKACALGGNGGFVFRYAGHKYCHFQMELNYMHRGWAQDGVPKNLHYLELPILMNLNFGSDVCRWIFNLGPQIGVCVKDETNSLTHRFDWGLAVGTGLYVRTQKAGVYELEIRYDFSLGGIYGTSVTDYYSMANPMDLSINLGWYWPLKKDRLKAKKTIKTQQ